jgi:hypothetical protein
VTCLTPPHPPGNKTSNISRSEFVVSGVNSRIKKLSKSRVQKINSDQSYIKEIHVVEVLGESGSQIDIAEHSDLNRNQGQGPRAEWKTCLCHHT